MLLSYIRFSTVCVQCFVGSRNSVFMEVLDAKKAFDRVNRIKLFNRSWEIGVPTHLVHA